MNWDYEDPRPVDRRTHTDFVESEVQVNLDELLADFDTERWEVTVGKMKFQIVRGNTNAAMLVLKEFMQQPLIEPIGMQSHVSEVFSERIANMLEFAGLYCVQSVHEASDAMLLTISQFGQSNLKTVRAKIAEIKKKESK
jgi:hypothetical protein